MKLHSPYAFTGISLSLVAHLALLGLAWTFWKSGFVRESSIGFRSEPMVQAHQIPEKALPNLSAVIPEIPEMSVFPEETLPEKTSGAGAETYPELYPTLF